MIVSTPLDREVTATAGAEPAPSSLRWTNVGECLDRANRSDAYDRAARWALETLQGRLGGNWLSRATAKGGGKAPFGLHLLGSHTLALVDALEWALRLELSDECNGSADFLRDLLRDPRPGRILHSRSQLTVAGLAQRLGWQVELEPSGEGRAPGDLALSGPSGPLLAEIRVLTQSSLGRSQFEAVEDGADWLFKLAVMHNVWIGGQLARHPTAVERRAIEQFVESEAPRAQTGQRPRLSLDGIALELSDRDHADRALTSPPVHEELFRRMVRVIADKVLRMRASEAQWLHVTALTGLWAFTEWGRSPLEEKLPVMASALAAALGDTRPEGIVLTSAAGVALGGVSCETVRGRSGIGLRRAIHPLRARETLVMPFHPAARLGSEDWLALNDAEAGWLDWALQQRCLPPVSEFATADPNSP